MSAFWRSQRVLVTGGGGFLGSFVVETLKARGCTTVVVPRRKDSDLREASVIDTLLTREKPTLIIHLAASCGGIGINQDKPGEFFYDNAIMGIQLMEYARRHGVQKFVQVGTICSYPKFTPVPFKEKDLWTGYPEETNAPYGLAKKMLLVQAQAYRQQYGFNAIYLMPANLYGPHDNFDLHSSHVIPALIRKINDAKQTNSPFVSVWGSGKASREFLFAGDAAEGIIRAAEHYNGVEPVNLGTNSSVTIKQLVTLLTRLMSYKGKIRWDKTKPDGQMKRRVDATRARRAFGFKASTHLREGLQKTIDWYLRAQE